MKAVKRTWSIILAILIVFGMFAVLPQDAEAAGKSIKKLEEGTEYSIDLNGGSSKEKVRWTMSRDTSNCTFNLYVNGTRVYKKTYKNTYYPHISGVYCTDLNTGDKYKELVIHVNQIDDYYLDMFVLRYVNSKKIKRYSYTGSTYPVCITSNSGENKFYMRSDTPFYNGNLVRTWLYMPYKISGEKVVNVKQSAYKIKESYTLHRAMKLYPKASKKNAKATLPAGTTFTATKFKTVGKSVKNYYNRPCYNVYLYVRTGNGKTGWLYFPAEAPAYEDRYLETSGGWG